MLMVLLALTTSAAFSQTTLSGMVNGYMKVKDLRPCLITVDFAFGLEEGDRILIIQMGNAETDGNGNVTKTDRAGYWELNTVGANPSETKIPLKRQMVDYLTFDVSKNVQVVKLPKITGNGDATVTGVVQGLPWDEATGIGGVIAIEVPEALILNGDIDGSGIGYGAAFRTIPNGKSAVGCGATTATVTSDAGFKGDGMGSTNGRMGRGPWATGGGGGMNHNSGGGGGANYGAGGNGGRELKKQRCTPADNGGIGGRAYTTYAFPNPRVFMGGAGGSGHQNNQGASDGARGGGIVIILAKRVQAIGTHQIISNGAEALPSLNDGAGGGGAGGTIQIFSDNITSNVKFSAKGGKGGDVAGDELVGPGGGGGGGVVMTRNAIPAANVDVTPGPSGEHLAQKTNHFAQPGQPGGALTGLRAPIDGNVDIAVLKITPSGAVNFCRGGSVTLSVNAPTANWVKYEDPGYARSGQSITVTESGTYTAEGTVGGCEVIATIKVNVWENPRFSIGSIKNFPPCGATRIPLGTITGATSGTPPYTYKWETDNLESVNPDDLELPFLWATPTKDTWYKITVTDANGCIYTDEFTYKYTPPINFSAPDVETCEGENVQIGVVPQGGTPLITFKWTPTTGLDRPNVAQPTVLAPTANQRYIVEITDAAGCKKLDTVDVKVKPLPKTTVSPSATICANTGTQLTATGGKSYLWQPADGLSCTNCPNPIARPSKTTTYRVLITDAKGCVKTDSVTVVVRTPQLSSAAGSIDFGKLEGCQTSTTQSFYLRNDDSLDVEISAQELTNAGFTVIEPGLPVTIKGKDSVRVVVRFSPTAAGITTSRLTLKGLCDVSYGIDLSGEQPTTAVSTNIGVVNFGQTFDCEATPRDTVIVVTNTGTAPLELGSTVIAAPFQTLYPVGPRNLMPGDTAHVVVRYAPSGAGPFSFDLLIPYVAGACKDTLRVTLNATNVQPLAAADLTNITFPTLVGCNLSSDTTITISNNGTVPVDLRLNGISAGFRVTSALPPTVPPGETRDITIRFEPTAQGTSTGEISFLYGPCNDTIRVTLSGTSQGVSFSIPDTLKFGELVFCEEQSRTIKLPITNTSAGSATSTVKEVAVVGPFTTSLKAGDVLPNNIQQQFDVLFTPTSDGELTGRIEITLEPCDVKRVIELTGSRVDAAFAVNGATSVSFGTVPVGNTGTQTVRFTNTGSTVLSNVTLNAPAAPFAIASTTPPVPATLAPGEDLVVNLVYTGTNGTQTGVIRAESEDPCVLAAEIQLEGNGGISATSVELPSFSGAPGQRVIVPMLAKGTGELAGIGVTDFTATLRFNRTLLIPANAAPITKVKSEPDPNDASQLLYTFTAPLVAGDTLVKLQFIAALGEMVATPVTITSFKWSDPQVTVALTSGTFTLDELCVTGATRVIRGSGEVILKPVRPNPVNTTMELEYEIVEDGPTELFISDIYGRKVAVLVSGHATPGRYVMTVDATRLESGTYVYVLQTPTQRLSRMMEVVK